MAKFKWEGVDRNGKRIDGIVEAIDIRDARKETSLREKNAAPKNCEASAER